MYSHTSAPDDVYFERALLLKVNRWWHLLHSPSSHWTGWSLTSITSADWSQPGRQASLPVLIAAESHNTCSEGFTLHQQPTPDLQGSVEGLAKVVPSAQFLLWTDWVWTSCKGGSEMENRGWHVCMSGAFFFFKPANCLWCYDCTQLNRLVGGNVQLEFCIWNDFSYPDLHSFYMQKVLKSRSLRPVFSSGVPWSW